MIDPGTENAMTRTIAVARTTRELDTSVGSPGPEESHGFSRRQDVKPPETSSNTDGRGRPRDYNAVARHRDLLEASIELALPQLRLVRRYLYSGGDRFQAERALDKAIRDLTVGTE